MKQSRKQRRLAARAGGAPMSMATFGNSYFGASSAKEFYNWAPGYGSADSDLLPELVTLRSRSRDLDRNHGLAHGGIQTLTDNVVGTGPRLSSTPDYRALGKDKAWGEQWSNDTEAQFRTWADTAECDVTGRSNLRGLTTQVFRGAAMNGEGLALPIWDPRRGFKWSTRLQVIESDRLSSPFGQLDTQILRGGIEIDDHGRPLAYWISTCHPGDWLSIFAQQPFKWDRIPAETSWGRKRVIHVHDAERCGQNRGKPILAPVIGQFRMLDNYQRTELQSAVINAMIAAYVETPLPPETLLSMFGGDDGDQRAKDYMVQNRGLIAPLKGAATIQLPPGTKLNPFIPSRPSAQYEAYTTSLLRHIAASIGIPYELLAKDFSKTNYSSARAALLEAWRFFLGRREWLTFLWLQPVYELWLEEAVNAGLVDAPDFYNNRYAYCRSRWIWPGRGWVDPVKEADAAVIRMDAGLSTLEREAAEQGADWQEDMEQRASELRKALDMEKEMGLPPGSLSKLPPRAPMVGSPYPSDDPRNAPAQPGQEVAV
jgi:lambda family phage portal protein